MAEANRSRTTEIKDIYTAEEVATMLRMNESSIYALAKRGIEPPVQPDARISTNFIR